VDAAIHVGYLAALAIVGTVLFQVALNRRLAR